MTRDMKSSRPFQDMVVFLFVILVAFLADSGAARPSKMVQQVDTSRSSIQQKLDQVKDFGLPILLKRMKDLDIPDLSGVTKTPLGQVEYNLKDIKLSRVSIAKSNVSITTENGVHFTAKGGGMDIGAKWHYREKSWPHISDSGMCDVSLRGMTLSVAVNLDTILANKTSEDSDVNCDLAINKVKVKFSGKVSWIYNLFSGVLARRIKPDLEKQICTSAVSVMKAKGLAALTSLPGVVRTDKKEWTSPSDQIR